MLTLFTTAKPFQGHDGIIQRNALESWKLLDRDVEVIVFGDDEGVARVSAELGLVHHPHVEKHQSGRNRLDYMFQCASQIARHEYLCYCNCDIVLMEDFLRAFEKAKAWRQKFLFVAQRWDVDITESINFGDATWTKRLRTSAMTQGVQRNEFWIDLFLFKRGLYLDMPPVLVAHCYWDTWMIWKALQSGIPVLDGTSFVMPIHQNHGYNPMFGRLKGSPDDALSRHNLELIGGLKRIRHIKSSTHRLGSAGQVYWNVFRYTPRDLHVWKVRMEKFALYKLWLPAWHLFLDATRPVRKVFGLRSKGLREGEGR